MNPAPILTQSAREKLVAAGLIQLPTPVKMPAVIQKYLPKLIVPRGLVKHVAREYLAGAYGDQDMYQVSQANRITYSALTAAIAKIRREERQQKSA